MWDRHKLDFLCPRASGWCVSVFEGAGLGSADGETKAGGRTFRARGMACTKACSRGGWRPRGVHAHTFKILDVPPLRENVLLSARLELKAEGTVDGKEQNSPWQVSGEAKLVQGRLGV